MGLAALAVQVVVRPREALGGVSRDIRVWRLGERFWKHFFGPISRLISLNHPVLGVVVSLKSLMANSGLPPDSDHRHNDCNVLVNGRNLGIWSNDRLLFMATAGPDPLLPF